MYYKVSQRKDGGNMSGLGITVCSVDSGCEVTGDHGRSVGQREGGELRLATRGQYRPYVVASVGVAVAAAPPPMPQHRPRRPLWTCVADGTPWPCGTARTRLLGAYGTDRVGLTHHLLWLMGIAATDLGIARPARLYRRFVAWTLPPGTRCRACGTTRHDVFPGVPPRFFPCRDFPDAAIPPLHAPRTD